MHGWLFTQAVLCNSWCLSRLLKSQSLENWDEYFVTRMAYPTFNLKLNTTHPTPRLRKEKNLPHVSCKQNFCRLHYHNSKCKIHLEKAKFDLAPMLCNWGFWYYSQSAWKVSGLHMHFRSYFFQLLTCWYDQWWYIWWESSCVVKHTPPCTVGMQWKRRPWCLKTHHSVM
jgi:hypothetical protein